MTRTSAAAARAGGNDAMSERDATAAATDEAARSASFVVNLSDGLARRILRALRGMLVTKNVVDVRNVERRP